MKTVVVGVGNVLRGDDGAGVEVVRCLRVRGNLTAELIDAGSVPENYLGPITRSRPALVIIIDAADMGCPPGTVREVDSETADWPAFSTHSASLTPLVEFVRSECDARVRVIGVQPHTRELGAHMSPAVIAAVNRVVEMLEMQVE